MPALLAIPVTLQLSCPLEHSCRILCSYAKVFLEFSRSTGTAGLHASMRLPHQLPFGTPRRWTIGPGRLRAAMQ